MSAFRSYQKKFLLSETFRTHYSLSDSILPRPHSSPRKTTEFNHDSLPWSHPIWRTFLCYSNIRENCPNILLAKITTLHNPLHPDLLKMLAGKIPLTSLTRTFKFPRFRWEVMRWDPKARDYLYITRSNSSSKRCGGIAGGSIQFIFQLDQLRLRHLILCYKNSTYTFL